MLRPIRSKEVGRMRLARLAAAAAVCVTLALMATGGASADPTSAPGAATVTYVCDGVPITLTTLPNGSAAAFTAPTSVGIAVGLTVTDVGTGDVIFSSVNHGFEVNALQTVTCTRTFNGTEFAVTAFFTPARK
jgi:hypothetical protein